MFDIHCKRTCRCLSIILHSRQICQSLGHCPAIHYTCWLTSCLDTNLKRPPAHINLCWIEINTRWRVAVLKVCTLTIHKLLNGVVSTAEGRVNEAPENDDHLSISLCKVCRNTRFPLKGWEKKSGHFSTWNIKISSPVSGYEQRL